MGQRDSDKLNALILDSITEGVFTVDQQFVISSFNAEAERIIGIPREQAIGRRCHEVFRASICGTDCALRQTVRDGEPRRNVRIDVLNAQMEPVPLSVSTAVLRDRRGKMLGGVEIFRDTSEVEALRRELAGKRVFADMVGASKAMQEIFALIPDVAASDAPVLIQGPSGTGKELVARAIHDLSGRAEAKLVQVNCGALPDTLLESELFGHVKGAFTGAHRSKPGRFQEAHGGTLFLDEIGDISPAFQVKLLRVLQEGELNPLGSNATVRVDVRIISATNHDLLELARQGTFREDLLYRIRVIPISIPPLRERREDIPLLVEHLLGRLRARTGRQIQGLSPEALARLYDHDFPGNVRELENVLERAFVLCRGDTIAVEHLPPEVAPTQDQARGPSPGPGDPPQAPLPPEARRLLEALEANHWNRTRTARALGIARNTLWRRMKAHGLG
jgi:PAS domain S-box-containing protein